MKSHKSLLLLALAGVFTHSAGAEIETAAASPRSNTTQVVGITEFTIDYSRPGVKEREIFGDLVPYGEIWRTGANATTKLSADRDFTLEGEAVPAGDYVLFTIPGEDEWTIIVYGDTDVPYAAAHDPANDVVRFTVESEELESSTESFHIWLDDLRDDSATLLLDWDDVRVPIEVGVHTKEQSLASIQEAMKNPEDLGARDYANAADFYYEQDIDLDQAAEWMARAVELNENAFWWQYSYARILAEQGEVEAALEQANASLAKAEASPGGDSGYIARNQELIKSLK